MRVARLTLAALLLLTTLAATLSGSPVAAQTATPILPVPSGQGLGGGWVSPAGYALVAFNEGTGLASRLVAIRPVDGSELFSVDLPGVVWDVTFDADGVAYAAVNNNAGDDQGWVFKISVTGFVEQQDLAPYVWPNQIEFGADGRLYVTTWPDPGNGALLALNASSLAVEAAAPLSEVGQLHARSRGLVLILAGTGLTRFFGYADIGNPTSGSSRPSGITFSSVTPEGAAYMLWYENSVDGERCSAGTVLYAAPDGISRQISTGPLFAGFGGDGCRLADLEALPGGGAAIAAVAGSSSRIVWIDAQGQEQRSAERVFDSPLEARLTELRVDGAGIVTLATTVSAPCPPGEFEDAPCAAVDLVGYDSSAAISYTTTIHGNQAAGADDDSVQLHPGAIGPERLFVGAGFVMLAGQRGPSTAGRVAVLAVPRGCSRRRRCRSAHGRIRRRVRRLRLRPRPRPRFRSPLCQGLSERPSRPNTLVVRLRTSRSCERMVRLRPASASVWRSPAMACITPAASSCMPLGTMSWWCAAAPTNCGHPSSMSRRVHRCNDAALIGVRGSGDNLSGDSYPGRHAVAIAEILLRKWRITLYDRDARGFGAIGLAYPASSVLNPFALPGYGVSVASGARNLRTELDAIRAYCGPTFPSCWSASVKERM